MVYPILDLKRRGKDLHEYLRQLEGLLSSFKSYDVAAAKNPGKTGVWSAAKIASIGVGVKNDLSRLAVNISTDRSFFFIKPCGLDVDMTSLADQRAGDGFCDRQAAAYGNHPCCLIPLSSSSFVVVYSLYLLPHGNRTGCRWPPACLTVAGMAVFVADFVFNNRGLFLRAEDPSGAGS